MRREQIVNLIRCHEERDNGGFQRQAYEIAEMFNRDGYGELARYIMALISQGHSSLTPQEASRPFFGLDFCEEVMSPNSRLVIPDAIKDDIIGIANAIRRNIGVNKFIFMGAPGTGKTEAARQLARMLGRQLYSVQFSKVIDSKLGQTQKNIAKLFLEINELANREQVLVLFDEIDALALDRIGSNDLREMGRATSSLLKELDGLSDNVNIIATTNLYKTLDKALRRRFDFAVDFDRYSRDDLIDVGVFILEDFLSRASSEYRNMRLFRKILASSEDIPYPGELKNIIKSSLAFSSQDGAEYLARIYKNLNNTNELNIRVLKDAGFTMREIETLTDIPKSTVAAALKDGRGDLE